MPGPCANTFRPDLAENRTVEIGTRFSQVFALETD